MSLGSRPARPPLDGALVTVFGSSVADPGEAAWDEAMRCGRLLAQAGGVVATGGYGGTMEAVSQGAAEAGGRVVGITAPAVFPDRPGANRWVSEEWPAATITERLHQLVSTAAAVIALPGSIGTFTELMVAWNLAFVARFSGVPAPPVVAVGPTWRLLVEDVATALDTDGGLVVCVPTIDAAVAEVVGRLSAAG